ncbi:MAG: adenylate/guanylate cyclase domain-containing protein [Polaribacter sp.]|uniref:adenylate/guanylate cyclase domain-containing protein n=1 Tax=Polaribacter sp. TaxID=1920175 RepID=UPI003BB057A8
MQFISFTYKTYKVYFLIGFFCLFSFFTFSQDQKKADSLKNILRKNLYDRKDKLKNLADIAYYETDIDEIIIYSKELIATAIERDTAYFEYSGYLQLGQAYGQKGDLKTALTNLLKAAKVANDNDLKSSKAGIKVAIADIYSQMGDSKLSVKNYKEAILLYEKIKIEKINDSINLASAKYNLGDEYYSQQKLDSSLYYYKKAADDFKSLGYEQYLAYILGSEGLVYAQLDDDTLAENSLNEAIEILEEYEDYDPITEFLIGMADVYIARSKNKQALKYAQRSLSLAEKFGYKQQISDANARIATIYKSFNNYKGALDAFEKHIVYRDSVNNISAVRDVEQERSKFELAKKEQEKEILKQEKKTQFILNIGIGIVLILIGFLAYFLYKRNKLVVETSKVIEQEKERSDELLKNILPEETAQELKEKGSVEAKRFDSVSVLFTDFKGFTKFSETLSPEELVKTIDYYFSKFDEIMEKHGIEKIKTVGDAYMCASGLPFPVKNHAFKMVKAAFDIVDFVNETMSLNSEASFDIRVGINSGSVVAGVVGTKKFAYDIWGDTVNTASRMESSGEIGKINISESTYNLLKNNRAFEFEERGSIEAKGKGKIKMYFVKRTT